MQQSRSFACHIVLCFFLRLACCEPAIASSAEVSEPALQGDSCAKGSNFVVVGAIGLLAGGTLGMPGLKPALMLGI